MSDAAEFDNCLSSGGVAVFPSDTVYGIGCDAQDGFAVERLYLLKRRARDKPCAVMFFDLELALSALPELGARTREALGRLLPGPVGVLLPNPAGRFPLACGSDRSTLGLRVPVVPALADARRPVIQSSANRAGGADPRELREVPELIRAAADMVIDGGDLPGTPSTLVDLRLFEDEGAWSVVRQGAVPETVLIEALGEGESGRGGEGESHPPGQLHFDPATYAEMIREDIPVFDRLQDELVGASGSGARLVLELGTGTGETARRLLEHHPEAFLVGIDESPPMLALARASLPERRAELRVARLQDRLPAGPFDLVASALCVHHLDAAQKADLFKRVRAALQPGGRFVLADVVIPPDRRDAVTSLTPGFDRPDATADQLEWLRAAGFEPEVRWQQRDLVVISAEVHLSG